MRVGVKVIKLYQRIWHPIYKGCEDRGITLVRCQLHPTCSEFALRAFGKYPFRHALMLTWKRLKKCSNIKKGLNIVKNNLYK